MDAIPRDMAVQLCNEILEENRVKWYSFGRWQCWGCTKFSKGNPDRRCFSNKEGYRGCTLINNRYDKLNS